MAQSKKAEAKVSPSKKKQSPAKKAPAKKGGKKKKASEDEAEEVEEVVDKPKTVDDFKCPGERLNIIQNSQLESWGKTLCCKFWVSVDIKKEEYTLTTEETDKVCCSSTHSL